MSPKLKPSTYKFSRVVQIDAAAKQLILSARPERTSLLLSVGLVAAGSGYSIGESADTGLFMSISSTTPRILLRKREVGDLVTAAVWNGGSALLRSSVNEMWELPDGECECDDGA